jgi:hypothetical protein
MSMSTLVAPYAKLGCVVSRIYAAAYYHIHFALMHPLRDGNGRVGRAILAAQCSQAAARHAGDVLSSIEQSSRFYNSVLFQADVVSRHDMLFGFLKMVLGIDGRANDVRLPVPELVHLDMRPFPSDLYVGAPVTAALPGRLSEIATM